MKTILPAIPFAFGALLAAACGGDDDAATADAAVSYDATGNIDGAPDYDAAESFDAAPDYDAEPTFDAEVFDAAPPSHEILINEFVVTPPGSEAIELYNPGASAVGLDGWTFDYTDAGSPKPPYVIVSGLSVPAGGFLSLSGSNMGLGSNWLSNAGATLVLRDETGAVVDRIGYGTLGDAPAPIYAWSSARVADGVTTGNDAADFNIDPTPTMGTANDPAAVDLGNTGIVINEWHIDSTSDTADFIEFYNTTGAEVSIAGWMLMFGPGDDYVFGAVSVPANGYYVLAEADFPQYIYGDASGWIYLFNADGVRVHQVAYTGITDDSDEVSYGFLPDGDVTQFWGTTAAIAGWEPLTPSPNAANAL